MTDVAGFQPFVYWTTSSTSWAPTLMLLHLHRTCFLNFFQHCKSQSGHWKKETLCCRSSLPCSLFLPDRRDTNGVNNDDRQLRALCLFKESAEREWHSQRQYCWLRNVQDWWPAIKVKASNCRMFHTVSDFKKGQGCFYLAANSEASPAFATLAFLKWRTACLLLNRSIYSCCSADLHVLLIRERCLLKCRFSQKSQFRIQILQCTKFKPQQQSLCQDMKSDTLTVPGSRLPDPNKTKCPC